MKHPPELCQWEAEVSSAFPHLSRMQTMVLALYSLGTALLSSCGISSIACLWARRLGQKENTVRQRLRESLYDREDKRGQQRREVEVARCFGPLLAWVLRHWDRREKRLALALDATTLGQRFTVLAISVLVCGCAIPVAWVVLPATKKGAWNPHWERLLSCLDGIVPADWQVIVLTDRGLYAKSLFRAIQRQGWHPLMRINNQGNFRPASLTTFRPLKTVTPQPGTAWVGAVTCFSTPANQLDCTLLSIWDRQAEEAWVLLTDLDFDVADVWWYALRNWIEQSFKDLKRGGFHWEQTKMTAPARAERLWLILALATLLTVTVGCAVEHALYTSQFPDTTTPRRPHTTRPRRLSLARRGQITLLADLLDSLPLPPRFLVPEPWPCSGLNSKLIHLLCYGGYPCIY